MPSKEAIVTKSFPILGLLGLILCTGKAFGLAELEWWQATLPFWIGPAFLMLCMAVALGTTGAAQLLIWLLDYLTKRNHRKMVEERVKREAARRERMN